jgi:hypothetical protein
MRVPVASWAPLQPLLAVQLVVLVLLQLRVLLWPVVIVVGSAEKASVGVGGALTVTLANWVVVPPGPLQARV